MLSKILLSTIFTVVFNFSSTAQNPNLKELASNLTGKERWGKSWKISEIQKRALSENGPLGNFEKIDLNSYYLGEFMASTRLPDSITFKINRRFNVSVFTGIFWIGTSDEKHNYEWTAGIWSLKKNVLEWECPDNYLSSKEITEFSANSFVISGAVSYGSEAFDYFEYKVKYELVDDGLTH